MLYVWLNGASLEYTVGNKEEGLICISGQFTLST